MNNFLDPDFVAAEIRNQFRQRWEGEFVGKPVNEFTVAELCNVAAQVVVRHFNNEFRFMLDNADTQLLERAAVLLAERVAARGDK